MIKEHIVQEIKKHFSESNKQNILSNKIHRIEIPINKINILNWIKNQKNSIKTYWLNKNQDYEVAGIGAVDIVAGDAIDDISYIFNRLKSNLSTQYKHLRYYGGLKFMQNDNLDKDWKCFGSYRFIIPLFEIVQEEESNLFLYKNSLF